MISKVSGEFKRFRFMFDLIKIRFSPRTRVQPFQVDSRIGQIGDWIGRANEIFFQ